MASLGLSWSMVERVERLGSENQRLRLFNAREVRRYKRPVAVPRGCENAQHILGTPAEIIGGVFRQENGPPDIETGVLGKTAYFSRNSPIEDWAALETERTLNKIYRSRLLAGELEQHRRFPSQLLLERRHRLAQAWRIVRGSKITLNTQLLAEGVGLAGMLKES